MFEEKRSSLHDAVGSRWHEDCEKRNDTEVNFVAGVLKSRTRRRSGRRLQGSDGADNKTLYSKEGFPMASRWQSFSPVWNQFQRTPLWDQLTQLQREMNRLVERWGGDGGALFGAGGSFPAVNIWEEPDALYLEAELPGVTEKDLEVHVTGGNQLTLKGERKQEKLEKGVWHRQERGAGTFTRVLTLPCAVDRDKVDARLENGILKVRLAKHEVAKPRKIVVKSE
jgi:HSP20 family protein